MRLPWGSVKLNDVLDDLEVSSGDLVFIHANLGFLGLSEFQNVPVELLRTLSSRLGEKGGVFLPGFTYSTKPSMTFDPYNFSTIESMGSLPKAALSEGYAVHPDPIFRVLASKGQATEILSGSFDNRSFGPGSLFSKLVDLNIKVLNIGTGSGTTLLHELEFRLRVPYRFEVDFNTNIFDRDSGKTVPITWGSYVRDLKAPGTEADFTQFSAQIATENFLHTAPLGYSKLTCYEISKGFEFLKSKVILNPNFLTKDGRDIGSLE
jgi:aminoglycoside N3'-acetyltransferase